MSLQYQYTIEVSGNLEAVDLFQRDIMDQQWYVSLEVETVQDGQDFILLLTATKGDLVEALDRATTNRNLVTRSRIKVDKVEAVAGGGEATAEGRSS